MYINRIIETKIKEAFWDGKVIIILGARQVGKTTLINELLKDYSKNRVVRINGDDPDDVDQISSKGLEYYKNLFNDQDIIFIDEAQKIPGLGNTIKLLVDYYKEKKQIIVTGSSSVNILDNTSESLTGRKYTFILYGLSINELFQFENRKTFDKNIDTKLLYGTYPEVITSKGFEKKEFLLDQITDSNLYKDILGYQNIKNPLILRKLLQALALQIGQEVSTHELSNLIGIDRNTVEKYIDLLEKAFIVFKLNAFSRSKRKEITKNKKIFFYDLGIRNALLNDFRNFSVRNDRGELWENFIILEKLKNNRYLQNKKDLFFWRTYKGVEIDLIEESVSQVMAYEIKMNRTYPEKPSQWNYGDYEVINRDTYLRYF